MAFFSSLLASKKIKPPGGYKTLEVLAIQAKVGNNDVMFVGIYRPPKALGKDYYLKVEEELNSICMWATMERKSVIIMGDLNLDRLKPDRKEGKILIDLEEVHGLECIITEPTRVTTSSATLLDVILTNNCQLFRTSGVFNPEISDHCLIYGLMKEKIQQHRSKVVTFRSLKNLDSEEFSNDLSLAPWLGEIFNNIDDRYTY